MLTGYEPDVIRGNPEYKTSGTLGTASNYEAYKDAFALRKENENVNPNLKRNDSNSKNNKDIKFSDNVTNNILSKIPKTWTSIYNEKFRLNWMVRL